MSRGSRKSSRAALSPVSLSCIHRTQEVTGKRLLVAISHAASAMRRFR